MKTCIICRIEKDDASFNDEHVIPDSIGGYYHIYKVCSTCNSFLGTKIDKNLTNHHFIQFQRNLLNIKGKSGIVPNPFAGIHTLDGDATQRVQIFTDGNKLVPKLLPKIPKFEKGVPIQSFSMSLDSKDENVKDEIINKTLSRIGLGRGDVLINEYIEVKSQAIHIKFNVDTHNFKMGLLKIAYEFAVDKFSNYFNDPKAISISKILHNADYTALEEIGLLYGSGFSSEILKPFQHWIDFENTNHYLILTNNEKNGLLCFVSLFGSMSIGIKLGDRFYSEYPELLIGKNDREKHRFDTFDINKILETIYSPLEYIFDLEIEHAVLRRSYRKMIKNNQFPYYKINGLIPLFDKDGNVAYEHVEDKINENTSQMIPKGDVKDIIITEIIFDETLYLKLNIESGLFKIRSVKGVKKRVSKL